MDVSREINKHADTGTVPVMTDLGLAPGWANIVAEHLYHKKSERIRWKSSRAY